MTDIILTSTFINSPQAKQLATKLEADFAFLQMTTFESGEFYFEAPKELTGKTVILFHHTFFPINETILQLALAMNAIRERHPFKLILMIPYLPYSRQDRSHQPGCAIGASVIAQILQIATPDALFVLDLHSLKTMEYFDFPVINLDPALLIAKDIQQRFHIPEICLISPDAGSTDRTKKIAERLNVPYVALIKERLNFDDLVINLPLEIPQKKICIFIDDMIDTGKTLLKAAEAFQEAHELHVYASHGIFSHQGYLRKLSDFFNSLTITDSILQTELPHNVRILSCRELFSAAIQKEL